MVAQPVLDDLLKAETSEREVRAIQYQIRLARCPTYRDLNGFDFSQSNVIVVLDELGYLPFSQARGALLFHLLSKLYEQTSVMINTNLSFAEWTGVFGDQKLTKALLNRLTHGCHIAEKGNDSYRFRHSSTDKKRRTKQKTLTQY